jgi:putative DNA primase/helicase
VSLLGYARAYARRGWPVVPVPAGSKRATLTGHGVLDATTDEATIHRWWRRWPDAGVAVACGHPGPQVLDIDDLEAAGGVARLDAPTVATSRGRHLYFAGEARRTIALEFGELRGVGNYVVAPPSVHPGGKLYVWTREPNGPLPPVPGHLDARAVSGPIGLAAAADDDYRIPAGQRYHHPIRFAGLLRSAGLSEQAIVRMGRVFLEECCEPEPEMDFGHAERGLRRAARRWPAHYTPSEERQ